jgi:Zn-dependent protease
MAHEIVLIVFYFIILMYSIILHEVSHGIAALWLGDKTALYAGRITLNPFKHIDLWQTVLLPILMYLLIGFAFGAAKPVPYNPYNLKNQKWGPALVGLAGPASNIFLALVFAIMAKFIAIPILQKQYIISHFSDWASISAAVSGSIGSILYLFCIMVVFWNVLLAFFNLIPIPPLDGSKLLFSIFKIKTNVMIVMEQFGFVFLILFIFIFSGILGSVLNLFWQIFFSITL